MNDYPKLILFRRPMSHAGTTQGTFMWESSKGISRHLMIRCIELPWKENEPRVSCIPVGDYKMAYTMSSRFHVMLWEVTKVPDRSGIRIHAGNFLKDTLGCILPCENWSDLDGDGIMDGAGSKRALAYLTQHLKPYEDSGLWLSIRGG